MKRKITTKALLWALLPMALMSGVSCEELDQVSSESVRFSMGVSSDKETRTSYSGDGTTTGGQLTKERINWTTGDLVTVYSPEAMKTDWTHYADYRVLSYSTLSDNLTSRATVEATDASGKGLTWEDDMDNHFYAMYPSAAMFTSTDTGYGWIALDGKTLKGTIPDEQTGTPDMRYAWMFAKNKGRKGDDSVELDFYPKFTAFEFTVYSGENETVTLSSFTLETTKASAVIAGDFSMNGDTEIVTPVATESTNKITVNFPSGTVVTPANSLTFTVFALPVNMTSLKITFTGTEIGTRSLALNANNAPVDFPADKKYRISCRFPSILTAIGEDILWDLEAHGESINWY